eukprot:Skav234157  [mRNA]  locus=scaffold6570:159815:162022:+ [translate_table: standard]
MDEVKDVLKGSGVVNERLEKILSILSNAGLAYKAVARPSEVMVHPSNRSNFMLNAFDVHTKGSKLEECGAKPSLLPPNSIAFEVSADAPERAKQFNSNEQLVSQAMGLLAPILKTERLLSVGCSHFTQWCRAKQFSAKTPTGEKLSLDTTSVLATLVRDGWLWTIIKAEVAEQIPSLPSFVSSALNSSNSNVQQKTEFEAMLELASLVKEGFTMKDAVLKVKESDPICGKYMEHIAQFTKLYLGSKFGPSLLLGEELCTLLAWYDFKADGSQLTLCRVALLTCMLTTKKSMDGFTKLVFKADFDKIKGPLASKAAQVESMLQTAWNAVQASPCAADVKFGAYGNLQTRMMLLLLNKQKFSREAANYETYQEIVDDFQLELAGKMAMKPAADNHTPSEDQAQSSVQDLVGAAPAKIAVLQNPHIGLGKQYTNKDYESLIFTLESIGDKTCLFKHYPLFDPALEVAVEFCDLKSWKVTKAKQPQLCPDEVAVKLLAQPSSLVYKDYLKATVQHLLWEAYIAASVTKGLQFSLSPTGVYTKQKFNKGTLCLYPLGTIAAVTNDKPKGLIVTYQTHKFTISNYKAPSSFEADAKGTLVPFNWVGEGDDPDVCNMCQKTVAFKGLTIPVLYNSHPVAAKVLLLQTSDEPEEVDEPPVKKAKA